MDWKFPPPNYAEKYGDESPYGDDSNHYTLFPLKFAPPLNFAPLIFAHPQISRPLNFRAPFLYCKFAVFSFIRDIFLLPLIFAHSYCTNFLPLIFAQARCAEIKGAQILMGIRYFAYDWTKFVKIRVINLFLNSSTKVRLSRIRLMMNKSMVRFTTSYSSKSYWNASTWNSTLRDLSITYTERYQKDPLWISKTNVQSLRNILKSIFSNIAKSLKSIPQISNNLEKKKNSLLFLY